MAKRYAAVKNASGYIADPVNALHETSGPTDLPIGTLTDGEFLKRVGGSLVSAPVSATATVLHETGGPTDLAIQAIADGAFLARSGGTVVGVGATPVAPQDVTVATAVAGTSTAPARSDHKHNVTTAAPSSVGTSNAEGSASSIARSDHVHDHGAQTSGTLHAAATSLVAGFMSTTDKSKLDGLSSSYPSLTSSAPVDVTKAAAAVGTATDAARADHKHDISTAAPGTISVGDAAAAGTATSVARSDHIHALTAPSAPVAVDKSTASAGTASTVARSDHKHDITTATAVGVGTANAEGSSSSLSRADHVHAMTWPGGATGSRPGSPVNYQPYFDTTLGIPIMYNGTNWVDAAGVIV